MTSLIVNTKAKASYKVRNWKKYDAALKLRGSITFWVSEEVVRTMAKRKKDLPLSRYYLLVLAILPFQSQLFEKLTLPLYSLAKC